MSQAGKSGNNNGQFSNQAPKSEPLAESSAPVAPVVPQVDDRETQEMRRRLDELEKALQIEREKNAELLELEAGRKVSINDRPYAGDAGWMFQVGPRNPAEYPDLKVETFKATDEAEAKRWYLNSHEFPKGSGIVIDPIQITIDVKCVDPKRNQSILLAKRLGVIRAKLDRGQSLSKEEEQILSDNEARVYNWAN